MTYLDGILAMRSASVERAKERRPLEVVRSSARAQREQRDFEAALRRASPIAVIAEFKRLSPSAGAINAAADVKATCAAYERGGAAALSVLTEPERFGGSFKDLRLARKATALPVLCKDFIVDEYQVLEAVAEGADAILLIAAALEDGTALQHLIAVAKELRVAALVEVHDAEEIRRAVNAGASIVGINNRDLHTFDVDRETVLRLRPLIPDGILVVAESGYRSAADVLACVKAGVHAVLVGEALMRDNDAQGAVERLRGRSL